MSDTSYNPTKKTADRAAELWRSMLSRPKFDNGDSSSNGGIASMMATMIPTNTTAALLDAFAEKLSERILTPSERSPDYFDCANLSVDYGPCMALSECAESVGLDCQFPWKTTMWVHADSVSVRNGYGAETIYHYALSNGKWLITTLQGSAIEDIKKHVVEGTPLEFKVE